ncbi:PRC-barrel domain-containing protein [Sphingoaurantiacus capsulatus]|uniref:PRC-barrel domain-containing protein n=1 Tax=Sphingoaurantiacus capsulatus TaxID=1771310 RepID=A0ABV7XBN7_9SPHN
MPAAAICGASVTGSDGESLGTVSELMIDSRSGGIAYAVLAFGGVMGVGEKLFAVPWAAFSADPASGELSLKVSASALAEREGFDKDAWPTSADASFS